MTPSPITGFFSLVIFTMRRQWRIRALGLVTFALLMLMTAAVGIITHVQKGWRIETRRVWVADTTKPGSVRMNFGQYSLDRLPLYQMLPGPDPVFAIKSIPIGAYQHLMLADQTQGFREDYAFVNYARWIVFGMFLNFLLPLFTLAYASSALGVEREGRTLIWLVTRPLPRWAVYVAKFLGVLPWCIAVAFTGFLALCLAGGDLGRTALAVYWPSVLAGSVALAALFHLIGAVFRRPAVVGLVYIFFFETLVANLPGSLKRLSLNYYVRSLLYNDTATVAPNLRPDSVDVYEPMSSLSSWIVLLAATLVITMFGAWLFSRQEPKEEV